MGISSALGSSALLPAGLGFRNKIINGDFRVWQRGTPITGTVAYTADRWLQVSGNSIVHSQSTDTPDSSFPYSLSMAGTGSNIAQRIESLNCGGINGTVTVSFWYKSTVGSDSLLMQLWSCNTQDSFGSLSQVGSTITVSASPSSSWTYWSYTFTGVSSNAKNGLALYIARGNTATSTTLITGVQVEANSQPTPFEQRPIGVELALCQRYCYNFGASSGKPNHPALMRTTTAADACIIWPVQMRSAPTAPAATSGSSFSVFNTGDVNADFSGNMYNASTQGAQVRFTASVAQTSGSACFVLAQTTTPLIFSAEL